MDYDPLFVRVYPQGSMKRELTSGEGLHYGRATWLDEIRYGNAPDVALWRVPVPFDRDRKLFAAPVVNDELRGV